MCLFIFRLWYILDPPSTCNHNNTSDDDHDDPTSLSVRAAAAAVISRSATSLSSASAKGPTQISYKNILPECLDENAKYPVYEQLPDTFDVTNELKINSEYFPLLDVIHIAFTTGLECQQSCERRTEFRCE